MKKGFLSFFFIMIFCAGYSQKKYNSEFIVKTPGDTTWGTVLAGRKGNFQQVEFKDATNQTQSYGTHDIISFYDREWGLFVTSDLTFAVYGLNKEEVSRTLPQKFFLEKIIQVDNIAVYFFRNFEYGSHFYIQKSDAPPEELISVEHVGEVNGRRVTQRDEQFKVLLATYLSDCPSIQDAINKTNLSEKKLQRLIEQYSSCRSKTPTYKSVVDKGEWSFGAVGGWSMSSGKYTTTSSSVAFKNYSTFIIGLSVNYLVSKRSGRVSVLNDLLFKKLEMARSEFTPYYPDRIKYDYQLSYLRWNLQVRLHFLKTAAVKPFVTLGISNSWALKKKGSLSEPTLSGPDVMNQETRGYEQGLLLGGGVNYKKIDLFARVESSNGFIPLYQGENTRVQSLYLGITYWFK